MLLSVIIPTRNRAPLVGQLLASLAQQETVSYSWEVIVVDNGCTDNTGDIVQQKRGKWDAQVRCVYEPLPGLHAARHRGAAEAKGEYLAYLDDDMVLAPTWLSGIQMLLDERADAVVGRILPRWETPPPSWLAPIARPGAFGPLSLLDLGEAATQTEHFYGCNIFIPKKTVLRMGGFHPDGMPKELLDYRGDGETGLWLKMRAAGMTLFYDPIAVAYHVIPRGRMTEAYLQNRAYNQGISDSFTHLRANRGAPHDARLLLKHAICTIWRYTRSAQTGRLSLKSAHAWNLGFLHHQSVARHDPGLREWTTRPDYFGDRGSVPRRGDRR